MDDILYSSLYSYFNALSKLGYMNLTLVDKLLVLVIIRELTVNDFRGYITEDDYNELNKALYCLFGSSCLIPYPNFCKTKDMNTLHLGDISELALRVSTNEEDIQTIKDTQVVETLGGVIEEVDDTIQTS